MTLEALMRIYREVADQIRLQPANSSMQPILLQSAALEIFGRVLAVLRKKT